MLRVRWFPDPGVRLGGEVRRAVERQVRGLDPGRLRALQEYEEAGDAIVLPEPDPYEGLVVKVVRHRGRLLVAAALWEHGGLVEECYVAELVEE
ncbi:hypothetical protein [Infirmifilum sp. SLHALR2]|nr:MAG: hypothetical protein B7L53_08315 [Thermofilum sp. NZ13]